MKKVIMSLKKDGISQTAIKTIKFIKYKFINLISHFNKNIICKEVNLNTFKNFVVFENNFGWNKIMKQRPQQIAENLPSDTLMFYHSHEDRDYIGKKRIRKIKENLYLIDLGYYRDILLGELSHHNNKFLMIYSTDYIPYKRINMYQKYKYKIIYEYVDDIDIDLCGKDLYKELNKRHKLLLNNKEVYITCTADKLYKNVKNKSKNKVKLITNGVDYNFFKYQKYDIPKDLIEIKSNYKYIIGYYGALASWFDYDLVKLIAKNKDFAIVLLGQDYDQTIEKSKILEENNIFYLGKKEYSVLPSYGCNFDIVTIPFLINQITQSTSPVKVFEYMAMQKPIVTTALPECKKYSSVLFSEDYQQFFININKALKLINNKKYLNTLKKEALENDWESKALDLINFVTGCDKNVE